MNLLALFLSIIMFASALVLLVQITSVLFRGKGWSQLYFMVWGPLIGGLAGLGVLLFLAGVGAL